LTQVVQIGGTLLIRLRATARDTAVLPETLRGTRLACARVILLARARTGIVLLLLRRTSTRGHVLARRGGIVALLLRLRGLAWTSRGLLRIIGRLWLRLIRLLSARIILTLIYRRIIIHKLKQCSLIGDRTSYSDCRYSHKNLFESVQ
jgi:hypothetical protein